MLLQIADAAARGVEHHVAPRQSYTRQEVAEEIIQMQACSRRTEKDAELLAARYAELSKTARLVAKTLGDGDALVAAKLEKPSATTAKPETVLTGAVDA